MGRAFATGFFLSILLMLSGCLPVQAATAGPDPPIGVDIWRVISMRDYNTRVVVTGTLLLGTIAGLVGSLALLRKRALLGDAVSHATLPGIGMAWIIGVQLGFTTKSLSLLLTGAAVTGIAGSLMILAIRRTTRLREDAALGIVLGVFFGAGVAILGVCNRMGGATSTAGLESFIYGKTASLMAIDTIVIAVATAVLLIGILAFFKELQLLCFDESFAGAEGYPVGMLDLGLMAMIVIVSIVGLQAVGLILMIALLVIPPAAARFWTQNLKQMMIIAAFIGGASSFVGAITSALFADMPSGAIIVLVAAAGFMFSMVFGTRLGVVPRAIEQWQIERKIDREHLLRALFEIGEVNSRLSRPGSGIPSSGTTPSSSANEPRVTAGQAIDRVADFQQLLEHRSWTSSGLRKILRDTAAEGWVVEQPDGRFRLTATGLTIAAKVVREHRLWEMYLIQYAETAPARVDRGADAIEHVLDPALIARLESELADRLSERTDIHSPHPLDGSVAEQGGGS